MKGYKPQAIDKLFAKETRKGIEFDAFSWLEKQYGKGNKAEWLSLYGEARVEFAKKEEERKERKDKDKNCLCNIHIYPLGYYH